MSNSGSGGNGLGFGSVLFLIFLTLKLCGVVEWSWWWVTSPLWIGFGVLAVLFTIIGLCQMAGKR
jgi:hypothetical protein